MPYSQRPEYHARQAQAWKPYASYTLLGTIVAFYVAQLATLFTLGVDAHHMVFIIDIHWYLAPWTLITATLSHDPTGIWHIIFNGIVLFFFGPSLERLIGWKRFVILFFVAGAIASILQVYLSWVLFDSTVGGLGASGALMMIFGALMVIMPNEKVLIWGIIPLPFWLAGIGFALLDIFGALNPMSGVGNFAHLSGMAIGLYVGWTVREDMKRRGLRLVRG